MRLHPLIAGTVGLWQFQDSIVDASGGGVNFSAIVGTPAYESLDSCVRAITFNVNTLLRAPVAAALQLTGPFTAECIIIPRATTAWQFFICANNQTFSQPKLYGLANDAGVHMEYCDRNINDLYIGSPGPAISWNPYVTAGVPMHLAQRRDGTKVEIFVNGVKLPNSLAIAAETAVGTEQFYMGGAGYGGTGATLKMAVASFRMLNYARADVDIAADATLTMGPCPPPFSYKNPLVQIRRAA